MASGVPVFTGTERGHPVFEVQVAIPRGQIGGIEVPAHRADVSGRTSRSDSAVAGQRHSRSIGARMLGMSHLDCTEQTSEFHWLTRLRTSLLQLLPTSEQLVDEIIEAVYFRRSRRRQAKRARGTISD